MSIEDIMYMIKIRIIPVSILTTIIIISLVLILATFKSRSNLPKKTVILTISFLTLIIIGLVNVLVFVTLVGYNS